MATGAEISRLADAQCTCTLNISQPANLLNVPLAEIPKYRGVSVKMNIIYSLLL